MTMTDDNGTASAERPVNQAGSAAPYTVPQPPASIDAAIWPGIAAVPSGFKADAAARIAEGRRAAPSARGPLPGRTGPGLSPGRLACSGHDHPPARALCPAAG